ncbi:MAG: peptide-methionine (S)-S-oxide reductase MsrA [Alistipes sp.]|nr:peptide-methionine (S)-S-oxide reductase MsrA [Alistipes sp.]MBR0331627.1 peptide-methionine (S)-S-oxide reductase MsrA [Alistipes sp.]
MQHEIYLAGGCFWGTQHFLKQIEGVLTTQVGYANGHGNSPTYEEVYTDQTGFAETVQLFYDPEVLPLERLLELYFLTIDPTSRNRQGGDEGTRYRTGIYYTREEQLPAIQAVNDRVAARYDQPLVVEVEHIQCFYAAEYYHQDYLEKNPGGYCHIPWALMEEARKGKL